jgi:CubicO group peptidase (beta-lactamase class C family)
MSDDKRWTRLSERIPDWMEQATVPGLSLAVIEDARVVWARGFGVASVVSRQPVDPDAVFEAASLSKPVFAYAVLQLCDRGVLDLDAPLADYMADPYIADEPRLPLITARRVLSHTSGLPNWRPNDQPLAMTFAPGERFGYSGEGYVYLQRVVERVTGHTLAEHMREHVLRPFGMAHSDYVWKDRYETQATQGHSRGGNPRDKQKPSQGNAAFSLHTTPSEFALFVAELLSAGRKRAYRIGASAAREMLRPQVTLNRFLGWGLGWGIQRMPGGDTFWHWGSNTGFKCFVVASRPRRAGVVVMTNSENGLRVCRETVLEVLGGEHPAFAWSGMDL